MYGDSIMDRADAASWYLQAATPRQLPAVAALLDLPRKWPAWSYPTQDGARRVMFAGDVLEAVLDDEIDPDQVMTVLRSQGAIRPGSEAE